MGWVRVGISGWRYAPWRGTFYPPGLPQRRELEYAAQHVTSIEINGTFYALQRPSSFQSWRAEVPDDFLFAVKGGRFLTHMKRLTDPETPLANFFASGVLALGPTLGPVLWQLPPTLAFDPALITDFCAALPRTTAAAARLASHHDQRLTTEPWTQIERDRPLRHALEVRHPSYTDPRFPQLLADADVASVASDGGSAWPAFEYVTTTWSMSGCTAPTSSTPAATTQPPSRSGLERVQRWSEHADVVVYFDNDAKVRAAARCAGAADQARYRTDGWSSAMTATVAVPDHLEPRSQPARASPITA